ncbi:MAG: alpha/beta fold hydrolase [Blastocatellia bacterium]
MQEPATSGQTVTLNDIELYFESRGEGEPLLLLHGGGGIGANWNLIFAAPPPGFHLIIPDLRGHGRTTGPAKQFTFRQLAQDVFALLDHLGIRRFKAIGLSLGAKTLLHVATQQPDRVTAMVLVSAAPYFPAQARAAMSALTPENRTEAEWQQMREWHKHGDEQIVAIWQQMHALKDSYDDLNFTPPYLSLITARTLIVHGDRDPLYPVALALEMYQSIPRSALWVIPSGGHGPVFGEHTGGGVTSREFAGVALTFLRTEARES